MGAPACAAGCSAASPKRWCATRATRCSSCAPKISSGQLERRQKMYNKILVPLDGSKLAEQVLPYARLLAEATGAAVELARVTDSGARAALVGAAAADYLKETAARCFAPSTKVTCAELTGKPAESIVDRAESETNCLIA